MDKEKESMVKEYSESRPIYEAFTNKIQQLAVSLLEEEGLHIHSVTSRTKDIHKFENKICKSGKEYSKFRDVTDLSGVRIICHSINEVENVANVIKNNFEVIPELSVDKREVMDPDKFGYLSLHYVVKLSASRKQLTEYAKYTDLLCEIQIRTLLQHAWAEIEHDLGYKSDLALPKEIKRRFYRLAGLLEMGDDEFNTIISNINAYTNKVSEEIRLAPQNIPIDKISLNSYVGTSEIISATDQKISEKTNIEIKHPYDRDEKDLRILSFLNIKTIEQLDNSLKEHSERISEFAAEFVGRRKGGGSFSKGVSIFYLGYLLICISMDIEKMKRYHEFVGIPFYINDPERLIGIFKKILQTFPLKETNKSP